MYFTSSNKLFLQILNAIIFAFLSSCVPKATEKFANCNTNQTYDKITRTCQASTNTNARYVPVANLSTINTGEETPVLINLSYTDGNSDKATSCAVSNLSTNLEIISPVITDGTIYNTAVDVKSAVSSLIAAMQNYAISNPSAGLTTAITSTNTDYTSITTALNIASGSFYISTAQTEYALVYTLGNDALSQGGPYTANATINYYVGLLTTKLSDLNSHLTNLTNRCYCAAGSCTAYVVPKKGQSGAGGFNYTITDVDGVSNTKSVLVNISAYSNSNNFLRPVVKSASAVGNESFSSQASSYTFTLGAAKDYFNTASFTYSHGKTLKSGLISAYSMSSVTYIDSDSGNGKITGCLGLGGSSTSSLNCTYVPNNGDVYSATAMAKKSFTIDDLTFTANEFGAFGNNLNIHYSDLSEDITSLDSYGTTVEKFGLINSAAEIYIRVSGDDIYVFFHEGVTTTAQIKTALESDLVANNLISISGGSTTLATTASAASPVVITAGVDGYDTFTYTVSNGFASSINTAKATIEIDPVTDVPYVPLAASLTNSTPIYERSASRGNVGTSENIDLSFIAVDGVLNGNAGCIIADTSVGLYLSDSAPTCSCNSATNICTATVYPKEFANGAQTFTYKICSSGGCSSNSTYTVNLTAVNDQPSLSGIVTPVSINENSSTASDYSIDLMASPGGGGFETSQTITSITATSSNTAVISNSGITFTPDATVANKYNMKVTPTQYQSGTGIIITVVVNDSGGTTNCTVTFGSDTCDQKTYTFVMDVIAVNDPPVITSSVTNEISNEGGTVIVGPFKVDEDAVNSTDENADPITLAVVSDNPSVLLSTNIKIFYDLNDNGVEDAGESRAQGARLEATADGEDAGAHNFYLKLTPVGGTSGSANIKISATDGTLVNGGPAKTFDYNFSFSVKPVSAGHGGWKNISSIGLKTDKFGSPAAISDNVCNYNTTSDAHFCSIGNCTSTASPFGTVTTTAPNVIYKDSSTNKCYYSVAQPVNSSTVYNWVEFKTACPITRVSLSENLITTSPSAPTAVDQYYWNPSTNTCYKSYQNGSSISWSSLPYNPAKVSLTWNAFTLTGSGLDLLDSIKGYNVYRREPGHDYDFKNGFLRPTSTSTMTITGTSTLSYIDNSADGGKVYYYTVRPVDTNHSIATYTPEVFSEVRVVAPTPNYSFVHRWMINQEICNKMHMTTSPSATNRVDPTNNYRCNYYGPGGNGGYYDFGKDLLVDRFEVGCPYTNISGHCANGADGCIGSSAPGGFLSSLNDNDIYYNRSTGSCYIYDLGTTAWINFNSATKVKIKSSVTSSLDPYNTSLNPPLVNVTNASAINICDSRPTPTIYNNNTTPTTMTSFPAFTAAYTNFLSLPEKKDYMAFSAPSLSITDADQKIVEKGESLNVVSRCNSSSASGLAGFYSDSELPTSSYIFTVPGTSSSAIRSIYNGSVPWGQSFGTESCSSRYGVQDIYGNVAEWVQDQMSCADNTTKICTATGSTATNFTFTTGHIYGFDLITGPFSDTDGSGLAGDSTGDSYLTNWLFEEGSNDTLKFSFPVGLPIYTNISQALSCNFTSYTVGHCTNGNLGCIGIGDPSGAGANGDIYLDHSTGDCWSTDGATWTKITPTPTVASTVGLSFLLDIGSSSGITNEQLHGDGIIVNGAAVYADPSQTGSFAVGGSYLSGDKAGRYMMELIPASTARSDVGLRCVKTIDNSEYNMSVSDSDGTGSTYHKYNSY
jgi:hypothetical protein